MNHFSGEILSGDCYENVFYLTAVKNISTTSTLSVTQLQRLLDYLMKQKDSFTLTLNDQLPVLLQEAEITSLKMELEQILANVNE